MFYIAHLLNNKNTYLRYFYNHVLESVWHVLIKYYTYIEPSSPSFLRM